MSTMLKHERDNRLQPELYRNLRMARVLTVPMTILAAIAAGCGLFWPGVYPDSPLKAAIQGQDLVTLLALPILLVAWQAIGKGSVKGLLVWLGVISYILYTYVGAAFAYDFNVLFPVYVALFSMSVFAVVTTILGINVETVGRQFSSKTPRKAVACFLALMAIGLGIGEIGQVVNYLVSGTLPAIIEMSDGGGSFIFALDLGLVVPLMLLAACWLWRSLPWGYVLAGVMLVKGATMGVALLSMNWFALRNGQPPDGLVGLWTFIAVGSLVCSVWLLQHCQSGGKTNG